MDNSLQINPSLVYRISKVCQLLGTSHVTLWRWVRNGNFPKPVTLGPNSKGWLASDVQAWLESRRAAASDQK